MKALRYEEYGPASLLQVVEVPDLIPAAGEVIVRVVAVGLNPVDYLVRLGQRREIFRIDLPSGIGSDFSGVVTAVGAEVHDHSVGDEVFGSTAFASLAEQVVVASAAVAAKPQLLSWEVAGSLAVAGLTAIDAVESQDVSATDTAFVSAAVGGVGVIVAQLARNDGATVIGSASAGNHEFLRSLGIIPVAYGPGLVDAVRALAPQGVTVAFDQWGEESIQAALELGVSPDRINTVATDPTPWGVKRVGRRGPNPERLARLAADVVEGRLVIPIDSVYPFDQLVPAFELAESRHVSGKVVIRVSD